MRILITGGAGYIGSMITGMLLLHGHEVTVYDNLMYNQTGLFCYVPHRGFSFIKADVRNKKQLCMDMREFDVIIPLAAIVGAPACAMNEKGTYEINYEQIETIIENKRTQQKVIFPSTDSVYGIGQEDICTEETPVNPMSLYAELKVKAEALCMQANNCVVLRQATVFGVSPRMRSDLMVNNFVYEAMFRGYIVLYESHVKRNFIHINDLCLAYVEAVNQFSRMAGGIFNVGCDQINLTKVELANRVKEFFPSFEISTVEGMQKDPDRRDYHVSNVKFGKLGFMAKCNLTEGFIALEKAYSMLPRNHYRNV